ncbi:hypothetical protein ABZP36_011566 [Zizania latifolia]
MHRVPIMDTKKLAYSKQMLQNTKFLSNLMLPSLEAFHLLLSVCLPGFLHREKMLSSITTFDPSTMGHVHIFCLYYETDNIHIITHLSPTPRHEYFTIFFHLVHSLTPQLLDL